MYCCTMYVNIYHYIFYNKTLGLLTFLFSVILGDTRVTILFKPKKKLYDERNECYILQLRSTIYSDCQGGKYTECILE